MGQHGSIRNEFIGDEILEPLEYFGSGDLENTPRLSKEKYELLDKLWDQLELITEDSR